MDNSFAYCIACPWQKVITTRKRVFNFDHESCVTDEIKTTVTFGECLTNCPFYDVTGQFCKRKV